MPTNTTSQVWFLTGASSGFGRYMTELVLKKGHKAVATLRKPERLADVASRYSRDELLILKLDVTTPEDISDAFAAAIKHFGHIDVVFSNAGHSLMAEVEYAPEDIARGMFETNFWGSVNVAKESLRVFRDVNKPAGGRLLQVSSISGIQGFPAFAHYAGTKHAINGFMEGLAAELDPEWNIKLTLIEPGAFRTAAIGDNLPRVPLQGPYAKANTKAAIIRDLLTGENSNQLPHPMHAVAVMYRLTTIPDPPLHFPLGEEAVTIVRATLHGILADAEKFASWSDGMSAEELAF